MKTPLTSLDFLFSPRSVAVIGAAREKGKVGRLVLENIIRHGYRGRVFPVNPKASRILGRRCFSSVKEIPEPVELAIIVIPSPSVQGVIEECAVQGVRGAIVISAGFREAGIDGARMENDLKREAAAGGLRLLGPNCLGLINTAAHLNASFARGMPSRGSMAFFSQSGALCQAILDWALGEGIGFSKFVSIGNKADIDEVSLLEALADDPATKVILGYVEDVRDGARFIEAASRVTPKKPVILTKSGTTPAGARAAASHTGALTGSEEAFEAACERAGIIRARTVGELFNLSLSFASQPIPPGPNLAVITNAGGPGIMAADSVESSSARMASLSAQTTIHLHQVLPPASGIYNPVDLLGDAPADRYRLALQAVLDDPAVDGALVILTPQVTTEVEKTAREVVRAARGHAKTVVASFMGGVSILEGERILIRGEVPNYHYPEHAVGAFDAMYRYRLRRQRPREAPPPLEVDRKRAADAVARFRAEGKLQLSEPDARTILDAYGFPLIPSASVAGIEQAVTEAERIGFPVAMKVAADEILHKSDVGGVRLGIVDAEGVRAAYREIIANARRYFPQSPPAGVIIQPMVRDAQEVIVGSVRDPVFGPVIMFGLGGISVEVLKDVAYRLAPLSREDARRMVREIRTFVILSGWRGRPPADLGSVTDCLTRLSALVSDFPEILEVEVNPLAVFEKGKGALAIDARVVIKEE